MKRITLTENDIRNLISEIVNEVYRKGWSVNPSDAKEMFDQFAQAYENEGPEGPNTKQIYGDIWGFAATALSDKVSSILGGRFDSFYYPEAVDKQFVEKREETMRIIYDNVKNGDDVLYNLARYIANKLKDVLNKNTTRNKNHVIAADTRIAGDNGTEKDIMDTLSNEVPTEEEGTDILDKMKMYLQSYDKVMPNVIRQILEDIINGIENMDPKVKEEIMSNGLTDKAMQQTILMSALMASNSTDVIPYPELQGIISKYRKEALYIMAQRTGNDPKQLQASPKDIKNAVVDRNPSGVLVFRGKDGKEKEYSVDDVVSGINNLINTRTKLSRLTSWFNEHDLDFEKIAQAARNIAEHKNRRIVRLNESQLKNLIASTIMNLRK